MRGLSRALGVASMALALSPLVPTSASAVVAAAPFVPRMALIKVAHTSAGLFEQRNSFNWSGYASFGTTFKAISGRWTQPAVDCSVAPNGIAVFWVGLDGYSSPTVEQDGTVAECDNGVASYYDWWEMYPSNAAQIVNPISAGDVFVSTVTYTGGGHFTLTVNDTTHPAASFTRTATCAGCQRSSSEWIAEAPCCLGNGDYYPLPNWGKIKFAKSSATDDADHTGTISDSAWQNVEIVMVNDSQQILAHPGPLKRNGGTFAVMWKRAR
jgi:hypothetical protein